MNKITAIRGFNDVLPEQTPAWRAMERTLIEVMDSYGYSQIRLPLVEETQLFARGVGEATDLLLLYAPKVLQDVYGQLLSIT